MPTFDTPEPIFATIELAGGTVRISANDRTDTVVVVRPSDPSNDDDVRAAEQTIVECSSGKLLVKAPKPKLRFFGWGGSIDLTIELPTGSHVEAATSASLHSTGRLGDTRLRSAYGDIWLDQTGKLQIITSSGDISVARTAGHTDVATTNGEIRIREIDGTALVSTSNGGITIGEVTGDIRLKTAYGDINVDRALASVTAKTAASSVRIGEVVRGTVSLETSYGQLAIGIREGTAAWLDVNSDWGAVDVALGAALGPEESDETVEVHARTSYGDIAIRRS